VIQGGTLVEKEKIAKAVWCEAPRKRTHIG